jgi:hypothetical protein
VRLCCPASCKKLLVHKSSMPIQPLLMQLSLLGSLAVHTLQRERQML